MNPKQKEAHVRRVRECLHNRRASVTSELGQQIANVERSRRVRGRDPVFGNVDLERRALERVNELGKELSEIDGRLAAGA